MKVCISGDWHLGLVLSGYDYHDDIVDAAKVVVDTANRSDMFVHLGDVYHDSRPTSRSIAASIELIGALKVPSVILAGNHDEGRGSVTSWEENRQCLLPSPDALEPLRTFNWDNHHLYFPKVPDFETIAGKLFLFVPYLRDAITQEEGTGSAQETVRHYFQEAVGARNLAAVFCHLDCIGASLGSEGAVLKGGRLEIPLDIAKALPCPVFNGHIHKQQRIAPNLYLPGSLVPTDFGDIDGNKGFIVAEL